MLAPATVVECKRLHAEGVSQRQIAERLGISRSSVNRIVNGKRPDYEALKTARQQQALLVKIGAGPTARCPTCGAKVILPCQVCQLRKLMARGITPPKYVGPGGDCDLDLEGEDRKRYEQIQKGPDRESQSPIPNPQSPDNADPLPERDFAQVWELAGAERDAVGNVLFVEESDCDQRPPTADELREAMTEC